MPGTAVPQPKPKVRVRLEPEPGSDLALLFAQLPGMEAAKNEAEANLKAQKKKIMAEVARLYPDASALPDAFDVPASPEGAHPAYTLAARQGARRLNAEALRAQEPGTYERFVVQGEPYWELARVRVNRVHR